jgi:hypothetical protein
VICQNVFSNEQYEELDISKNSGKHYKNTNFDKEDILANHKSFMSSMNIPINEEMMFTYFKLNMFVSSTGQNSQVMYYHLVSVVCYPLLFILIFNLFLRNCKTKCFNSFTYEQYEELDISKNSIKPYKNINFDKEDNLANHKSFISSLNI